MAADTKIEWCDHTANLWIGCTKVSAGCDHCYAERDWDKRRHRVQWGPHGKRSKTVSGWAFLPSLQRKLARFGGIDPVLGRKPTVFINSLSDFFDNHASVKWRDDAWELFRQTPDVIKILVTKRPQNIAGMLPSYWDEIASQFWMLTSTENQVEMERRVPALFRAFENRQRPEVYGLSMEPLLGPIDFAGFFVPHADPRFHINWLDLLDWIIVGGESGPGWREMPAGAAELLMHQAAACHTKFFMKQMAGKKPIPAYLNKKEFPDRGQKAG